MADPTDDRQLMLWDLPGSADEPFAGGARFVAYCLGAEARAWARREAVTRAWAMYRRAIDKSEDPYPAALLVCQRMGAALEDLARLAIAVSTLHSGEDAFDALRRASIEDMTETFRALDADPEKLRSALRLPSPETTEELGDDERAALLEVGEVIARRWTGQWQRAASGWLLLNKIAKAMRHGSPLPSRELIVEPPGGGVLGEGLGDRFGRWVLIIDTTADHAARSHHTSYGAADLSEETLARARAGGLDAISLAKDLAEGHVQRVMTTSRWALPRDAMRQVPSAVARVLRENQRG